MEYQALYRKYRPQSFDDVIGQAHVTSTLAREVAEGHVAHAYLFAGPRGTGKTTTARILAKALNCENRLPDGSPDNTCAACQAITEGSSLDVMEMDAASHNSVDDIRDMRVSVATVATSGAARRVFILDEAHMLSKAAGNALLKTLEEPPEHVHFVLATTEPYKLLDTIRSRTQRFDFHSISVEALAGHLGRICDLEEYRAEPAALVAVARHARGSARDSLSLLEQVAALGDGAVDLAGVSRALGLADADAYTTLATAIVEQDARGGLELVARLASQGADLRRFVSEAVGFFRGVFLAHYAPNLAEVTDEPAEVIEGWKAASSRLGAGEVLRAVDVLGDALVKLREGREERLMVELAVIKLTRPETAGDPAALMARLDRMERRVAAGEPLSTPAVAEPSSPPKLAVVPPPAASVSAETTGTTETAEPVESEPAEPDVSERVETTAPAAEEVSEPSAAVTAAQFEAVWPALFGGLRDVLGARRWALFRETQPGGVDGGALVVEVRHGFHLEALRSDPAVAKIVATRAGDLLGSPVRVEFRDSGSVAPAPVDDEPDVRAAEFDKDNMAEAPTDATDPFRLVADELGAEVVDEFETPDD